jgi:outer membrane biosynthesis protein TonB
MNARGLVPWLTSLLFHAGVLLVPLGLFLVPARDQPSTTVELTFTPSRPVAPGTSSTSRSRAAVDPSAAPQVPSSPAFRTVPSLTGKSSTEDSSAETETGATTASGTTGQTTGTSSAGAAGQDETGLSIGWTGAPRKLIHGSPLRFPASLSAAGQEVEGVAQITVSPSGAVVRVEITKPTGYIEIDIYVQEALGDYLFSRVDSKVDAHGTVQFRFRLEKTD